MSSFLRKAMLPAAIAIAMIGFLGVLGQTRSVQANPVLPGDICAYDTDAPHTDVDENGNLVHLVAPGVTYGFVFRLAGWDYDISDYYDQGPDVYLGIDSERGSARLTSKAEGTSGGDAAYHALIQPPTSTQLVDTFDPADVNNPDNNDLNSINEWLIDAGYSAFANNASTHPDCAGGEQRCSEEVDNPDYNGYNDPTITNRNSCEDYWGFVDFECIEPGTFHIWVDPYDDYGTENTGLVVKFVCGAPVDDADIDASPKTLEASAVGSSKEESTITVTAWDRDGFRVEHAIVHVTTDHCYFTGQDSPAGGKPTSVEIHTDTDTSSDDNYLLNNPAQFSAGTAEVTLDCTGAAPGVAHVKAIVERPGADLELTVDVTVVGSTASNGLKLTLTPDDLECGETILASVTAVDSDGQKVSDGTVVYFTTDTSSGIVGGSEGAQGGVLTKSGEASVYIATDPGNPGIHTVIAYALDGSDKVVAQTSETYTCDAAVAPAAPTVAPPATGTGTGSITPPNTGDAGLASTTSGVSLIAIVGVLFAIVGGVVAFRPRGI